MRQLQYRALLPAIQTVSAILCGGIGLSQRNAILKQPWLGEQTMADTTARFHVWPLPLRFALVNNLPALTSLGVIGWPLSRVWPGMPIGLWLSLLIACTYANWYLIGRRLDSEPSARKRQRWALAIFGLLSGAVIFTPGYVGFVYTGILLWVAFAITVQILGATR